MPRGIRCALFEHDSYRGWVYYLEGTGTTQQISDFERIPISGGNVGDDVSSCRFECYVGGDWHSVSGTTLEGVAYDFLLHLFYGPLDWTAWPYLVVGDVYVPSQTLLIAHPTLTVHPGVTVLFDKGTKITSYGTLQMDGTQGAIRLRSFRDNSRGMTIWRQLKSGNGGEIKVW